MTTNALRLRAAPLRTPSDLGENAVTDISAALTGLLADT
ncbi:DNA starvation/stationary phase protection protein, partial [Mesorhizobium sp. M7A.F.Ca.CA.004.12.1.1]